MLPPEVLTAAGHGWRMFPVKARGKEPLVRWKDVATSDLAALEALAAQFPGCNWGMATGKASGVLVLDLDGTPGRMSVAAWEATGNRLPKTRTHRTGKGLHHLFGYPDGHDIRNSVSKLAPGVDIRGEGGFIVIPPSVHESGSTYEVIDDAPLADVPQWLLAKLTQPTPPPMAPTTGAIPAGERNSTLTSLAGTMRRKGMSEAAILAALREENGRCTPPLEDKEVQTIARSVSRYDPAEVAASSDAPWPEPEGFGAPLPPVAPLTPDMLPDALRGWCVDQADRLQTPLDFTGVLAVLALGAVVMRGARVFPKTHDTDWFEYAYNWGGIVAPPAAKKSPAMVAMLEPVREIEAALRKENEAAVTAHRAARELYQIEVANWKKEAAQLLRDGKELKPRPEPVSEEPPKARTVTTSDATFEAAHALLADNPAGITLVSDELSGWFATLKKQGREGERAFFVQGWSGRSGYTAHRIGRGKVHVPHVAIEVIGMIQPGPLQAHFADGINGGASADGFMERFSLMVWPDSFVPQWTDRKPNEKAKTQAFDVFRDLVKLDAEHPISLQFDREAQAEFIDWWEAHSARVHDPELPAHMVAHLSKYQKTVSSLALLFALTDGRMDAIGVDHLRMAIAWARYLESHARRVYSMVEPSERTAARILARRIQGGWKLAERTFTLRDVHRNDWTGLSTPDAARAALAALVEYGWLRKLQAQPANGRPSERYEINPAVTASFPDIEAIRGGFGGFDSLSAHPHTRKNSQGEKISKTGARTVRLSKPTKTPLSKRKEKSSPPDKDSSTGRVLKFAQRGGHAATRNSNGHKSKRGA
jgi:putative DNA primase/helicase